jgi:hypothetical protein
VESGLIERQIEGEERMTTSDGTTVRPGLQVGPTSEFSLFFRVKPGAGEILRQALRDLQDTPGYRPGDYGMAVATSGRLQAGSWTDPRLRRLRQVHA